MKIADFDCNEKILIVAEIGNNHEGDVALAERMIGLAARAGADAVKFQTIIPEKLIRADDTKRIEQLNKFRLSFEDFKRLAQMAHDQGVIFLSTPFDLESAEFLSDLVPAYKIASGDNNFYPLIEKICKTGKPVMFSTGLADLEQIKQTRDFIQKQWSHQNIEQDLAILHCVSKYPTPPQDVNLNAINTLKQLEVMVGYSDHSLGVVAALAAAAMGARIIEKHFTIDKNYSSFRDHQISSDPDELKLLVENVREIELIQGSGSLSSTSEDQEFVRAIRRSITASKSLEKGAIIKEDDLNWVRPSGGLQPGQEEVLLGKILKRSVSQGEILMERDVSINGEN